MKVGVVYLTFRYYLRDRTLLSLTNKLIKTDSEECIHLSC